VFDWSDNRKIQFVGMKFLRNIERKTRCDRKVEGKVILVTGREGP
jgi:hypothetical protein